MRRVSCIAFPVAVVLASWVARAEVSLEPFTESGITAAKPAGWTAAVDADRGVIVLSQDPSRADGAQLVLIGRNDATQTEDQMIDAAAQSLPGFKVLERSAFPGGAGKQLVAEGKVNGVAMKLGVLVIRGEGGLVALGMIAARKADYDLMGGLFLVVRVMSSMPSEHKAPEATTGKSSLDKALDRANESFFNDGKFETFDELDPNRPPLARERLLGTWKKRTGSSRPTSRAGVYDSHGTWEGVTLKPDGSYTFQKLTSVSAGTCASEGWETETGAYSFDGRQLVLKPKQAFGEYQVCGGAKKRAPRGTSHPTRAYDVAINAEGRLLLHGPSCAAYEEGDKNCRPRTEWVLRAGD